jgi:hypothetical protein
MTDAVSESFHDAAQAENGMAISAGARASHVRTAVAAGRSYQVDLSRVPEADRAAVIARIQEIVNAASGAPLPIVTKS